MYNKKLVFWTACAGMLLFGIVLITLGSIGPDLRIKFGLDDVSSGTLFAILPFGILGGSLFFGPVSDRFGFRFILAASCILMFIGFEGIAYARSMTLLQTCILLIGFGGGIINGATNAVVADISGDDRGSNLSLLGVFFGVGALGMPLALGFLKEYFTFETIVSAVGVLTLAIGIIYIFTSFPSPKQKQGISFHQLRNIVADRVLLLIAFFLFFQSSFEGIINNWTTTYLIDYRLLKQSQALFGLSAYVAGMSVMRLLIGTLLKDVPVKRLMIISFLINISGIILLRYSSSFYFSSAGLFIIGAGLASGFPVMLGLTGDRYAELSGTAFSFVLFIGLAGNMLFNYGMGFISRNLGVRHLSSVVFLELLFIILLFSSVIRNINKEKNPHPPQ